MYPQLLQIKAAATILRLVFCIISLGLGLRNMFTYPLAGHHVVPPHLGQGKFAPLLSIAAIIFFCSSVVPSFGDSVIVT